MAQLLKVDEWQSPTGRWYVADTKTWTGWQELAEVLGMTDIKDFQDILTNKYGAVIDNFIEYDNGKTFLAFYFLKYKGAHQFKLDINRIARKKNFIVEKAF